MLNTRLHPRLQLIILSWLLAATVNAAEICPSGQYGHNYTCTGIEGTSTPFSDYALAAALSCYSKIWADAGCTTFAMNDRPYILQHNFAQLTTDSANWASIMDARHIKGCQSSAQCTNSSTLCDTKDGPLRCEKCDRGQYQDETGQSSCKDCAAGKYCPFLSGMLPIHLDEPTSFGCLNHTSHMVSAGCSTLATLKMHPLQTYL